ncbi:MAG: aminotransferase class I/II-fold pyridoxal phosphate-dependent enzyme [Anaerolineae bacterium]|nr:aminotransferase class I/II-fold pyridoxal phosphate-dependent enzyme [Anaerolineae bacterium]
MAYNELGDLPLDDFRRVGHEIVDWIADYLDNTEQYPVLSQSKPGEIKSQLPDVPPLQPESLDSIMADFQDIIMPGITHWNHPNFYAYFSNTGSVPGILAEMLITALNVNGMLWRTSPAATELEEVTMDWLRQLLGLADGWDGIIMDGASMSSMVAIAAAREAVEGLDVRTKGMAHATVPQLRVYISEQTHSSLEKGAMVLGIGQENVVKIPVDCENGMDVDALETAVLRDIDEGKRPFFVCATVGTTSATGVDPVPAIADIAQKHNMWLHVDGAYGGMAAIVPEKQHLFAGVDRADSLVVNPHKWLFTPMDLSAFYTRRPDIVKRAFSLLPEYLRSAETDANTVRDYMDYGVQLGRRFRALKLWFVLRAYGQEGLIARLRDHMRLAQLFGSWVEASPTFERMAPIVFSTVCFRAHPQGIDDEETLNKLNEALMNAVNDTGHIFISHTKLQGSYTLRLAIGNIRTAESHIRQAWILLQKMLTHIKIDS